MAGHSETARIAQADFVAVDRVPAILEGTQELLVLETRTALELVSGSILFLFLGVFQWTAGRETNITATVLLIPAVWESWP